MEEEKLLKRKKRAQEEQNLELLANTLKKLAELYYSKGQYEEALNAYEEERDLWSNLGKPMEKARASRFMGEIYCHLENYKDALSKLKEYLLIATEEKDLIEEQRALATIGRTFFCKAESVSKSNEIEYKRALREAKQAYIMSLKVCDKLTNVNRHELLQMRGRLLLNIGLVFECQGDFEKAVEHIQMAISINVKADLYDDTQQCYTSQAALYQKQGNTVLALKYYDLALEVQERLPNKIQLMCETLGNKADVYFSVANYKAAKQSLIRAYRLCRVCANVIFKILQCLEQLGCYGKDLLPAIVSLSQTYKDAGRYEESLEFFRKELDIWEDNSEEACKTSLNIVRLLELKKAGYSEIMENLQKSHDYAIIANNEELEIKVLCRMLKIQEKNGFAEEANETRNKIDAIKPDVSPHGSSYDSSDDEVEVETPELVNNTSLSEILEEELEPNSTETSRPRQVKKQKPSLKVRRNEKGETPLHTACIHGCANQVQRLLDFKHPVNVTDNAGWTPLHEVCNHGHVELVNLLLDNGANINDPGGYGSEGVTPLHDACSNGHLEIVQILLDRGASTDVRTNDNKTPLDFLLEWASRTGTLSQDQTSLFETIKEKLQRDLEKAGVSTKTVKVPLMEHSVQKTNISEKNKLKQKSSESRVETGKRYWSDSSSESEDYNSDRELTKEHTDDEKTLSDYANNDSNSGSLVFSPALVDEDPALEYQKVMKGLRKRVVQKHPTKLSKTAKSGALIGDSDVVNDWLIDDLKDQTRPNKKRKTRDADMGGSKLIATLRKDVVIEENMHKHFETDFMEIEELPSDNEETTQQFKKSSSDKKSSYQNSFLNSGNFCASDMSGRHNALSHSVVESDAYINVKIRIEETSLLVPICREPVEPLTIDWLTKEAASRFLKFHGREPLLVLETSDGAKLAADDPIAVINERELIGKIIEWKTVSLRQRYEAACSDTHSVQDKLIKNRLQECDNTHCLDLNDCIFDLNCLKPLIQSIRHENSLRELLLGSNALMDEGIKIFSTMEGLPVLEVLNLKCNNITSIGLTSLVNFLIHCQSLKILDLSFNDFDSGWLKSIHRISKYLDNLISLNLKACDMSGNEFLSWKENEPALNNLKNLEELDVSDNPLGEVGINGFLCNLKANKIRKLCVSKTASGKSKGVTKIVQFFQKDEPLNLRFLDLADCDINDKELMEIIRCLRNSESLRTLLLCNNADLKTSSLDALMSMQNMPRELDLCGCDSLYPEVVDDSNDLLVNNEVLQKLNSLTMDIHPKLKSTKHWSDKFEERWKQIWGVRGKVLKGPSGKPPACPTRLFLQVYSRANESSQSEFQPINVIFVCPV
ncbi:Transient receptor potential channel pyrexia [Gryllus bimaculatus]|nr:Transient receptor potential channel pyrexia [Gryllus bimaculatus]